MTKVLVIDDEEAIRFVFQRFLSDAGYEVSLAAHENDARNFLSAQEFDVAVVDRILPGGESGLEILKEIRTSQPSCEVIMMSGMPLYQISPESTEGDPIVYLTKPIKKAEIVQAVKNAAEKSKIKKEHASNS